MFSQHVFSAARLREGLGDWTELTPEPIRNAVAALRRDFDHQTTKIKYLMDSECYERLHPVKRGLSESSVFLLLFKHSAELLAPEVARIFDHFLEIALAQAALIECDPVDWSSNQMTLAIADTSFKIAMWLKDSCDKQEIGDFENDVEWAHWRCPRWVLMQPFGQLPYDKDRAWERLGTDCF